jgi:hypothetical protein
MVTVRTSRLSCVNISMVSRMSPVFIMLIVVCLSLLRLSFVQPLSLLRRQLP